eukprot:7147678-Alexandrium_andersonii.AAC.1
MGRDAAQASAYTDSRIARISITANTDVAENDDDQDEGRRAMARGRRDKHTSTKTGNTLFSTSAQHSTGNLKVQ